MRRQAGLSPRARSFTRDVKTRPSGNVDLGRKPEARNLFGRRAILIGLNGHHWVFSSITHLWLESLLRGWGHVVD